LLCSCSDTSRDRASNGKADKEAAAEREKLRQEWDLIAAERKRLERDKQALRKAQAEWQQKQGEAADREARATGAGGGAEREVAREAREEVARRQRRIDSAIELLPTQQEREVIGELWRRLKAGTLDLSKLTVLEGGQFRQHHNLLQGPELDR